MSSHRSTQSTLRHLVGFFVVLALMVSGALDVMLHAVYGNVESQVQAIPGGAS